MCGDLNAQRSKSLATAQTVHSQCPFAENQLELIC